MIRLNVCNDNCWGGISDGESIISGFCVFGSVIFFNQCDIWIEQTTFNIKVIY